MRIIVDAFGGDNAPLEVIKGAQLARQEYQVEISLSGDRKEIEQCAKENGITKTALMIIGDVVSHSHYRRSDLYHPAFTTEFREASE